MPPRPRHVATYAASLAPISPSRPHPSQFAPPCHCACLASTSTPQRTRGGPPMSMEEALLSAWASREAGAPTVTSPLRSVPTVYLLVSSLTLVFFAVVARSRPRRFIPRSNGLAVSSRSRMASPSRPAVMLRRRPSPRRCPNGQTGQPSRAGPQEHLELS